MEREGMNQERGLESLVGQAKGGDKDALEEVIRRIQDRVYGLAIRMLYYPADAEDASQEILVKVITHLEGFRGESRFMTWVYRIASNHLLNTRKRRAEEWKLSFEIYEEGIQEGLSQDGQESFNQAEKDLLIEEVKLVCMQGMLICMNREIRLAYILGEIFGVTSSEGGEILDITPEAFRQRLSRGRKQLGEFMSKNCGLINPANRCHCERLLSYEVKRSSLDPENLLFADHPCHARRNLAAANGLEELDEMARVAVLFRSHPDYAAPAAFVEIVKKLVDSEQFQIL